jgi:hypothetical protein
MLLMYGLYIERTLIKTLGNITNEENYPVLMCGAATALHYKSSERGA